MNPALRLTVTDLAAGRGGLMLFRTVGFSLGAGEALVITGPNGAGKTTLLRVIAGFIAPERGTLVLDGVGPDATLPGSLHFLGHRDGLKGALTARENLAFASAVAGEAGVPAEMAATRLNLTRLMDLPVSVLSAGQRRRVALARLLVTKRPVWLLDEPTAALDTASSAIVTDLIAEHVAQGGIVLAATHLALGVRARELSLTGDGGCVVRSAA